MKYNLALCVIIKDERNLEEFILYYWSTQRVEHFYIYDNESTIPIKEILNLYLFSKICTIIDYPGKYKQMDAYNDCLKNYGNEIEWLLIVDGDEYICPYIHSSLKDFLDNYKDAHAIGINWVFFGTSFHDKKQEGFVIDKYRYSSNSQDKHIKSVFKPEFVKNITNPHFVNLYDPSKYIDSKNNIISGAFNYNYTIDIIQINHYYSRSIEDSYEKQNRGKADDDKIYVIPHLHELYNDFKNDFIVNKYLKIMEKTFEIVNTNWEIYKVLNEDLQQSLKSPNDYYKHLFNYGLNENRPTKILDIYPNFSKNIYRKKNPDLNDLNDLELEIHYITLGFFENRECN
jgi:hypothetical protein